MANQQAATSIVRRGTLGVFKRGLGTASPDDKLHVVGNLFIEDGSPEITFETTSASHANWQIAAQEWTSQSLQFASGSNDSDASNDTFTPRLTILNGGQVGIGTSAPATTLDVYGHLNLRSTYNLTWGGTYGANIPSIIGVSGSSPYIVIYPAGSTSGEKLRIAADGTLTVGGNVTVANDTPKLSIKDTNYSNNTFDIDFNGGVSGFFTSNANTYFSFKGGGE